VGLNEGLDASGSGADGSGTMSSLAEAYQRLIAAQFGRPLDGRDRLDLAAVGLANCLWKSGVSESVHVGHRCAALAADDQGGLRLHSAVTKCAKDVVDSGRFDVGLLCRRLSDPRWPISTTATAREFFGVGWVDFVGHVEAMRVGLGEAVGVSGADVVIDEMAVVYGGIWAIERWGTPWWPRVVERWVADLDDAGSWAAVDEEVSAGRLAADTRDLLSDGDDIASKLLAGPEELTRDQAAGLRLLGTGRRRGTDEKEEWVEQRRRRAAGG
jgi:hypothetical protein